ncbi:MAG: terminase, partial [Marmoricola sp.]|nr:terminase [Marmoricola sp.]
LMGDLIQDQLIGLRGRDTAAESRRPTFATPGLLAKALDPTTRQTPALDKIDQALVDVDAGRCDRLIVTMPPQEGKSTRVTKTGPLWMLGRNPQRRIVVVSYDQTLANEFGRDIRNNIATHNGSDGTLDLGLRIARDNGSVSSWRLAGARGGVRSVGVGGGITGRSADVMFIDDPIKNRAEAESEVFRQRAKDFWTSTGSTRLSPGAPVIVVLTRWHEDDLAGWLLQRPDGHRWRVINIPAEANHDPAKGETDPLGRQPGQYMESARTNEKTGLPRSASDWDAIKVQAGSRDWEALYQGNPHPPGGAILHRDWWKEYSQPQWLVREDGAHLPYTFDEVIQSWDLTFKKQSNSARSSATADQGVDRVVGQVWGRRGIQAYLLDQVCRRMNFPETVKAISAMTGKWPTSTLKLVEDKANGPAVISLLEHRVMGIVGVEPDGSKEERAAAVSPLIEAGSVFLPSALIEGCAWVDDFVTECAGFPNAKHDDQVDAMTQALNRLILRPFVDGQTHDLDELDDELADYGSYVP